jgi:hypothetical protein
MNERIKELAEQAGIEFTYDPTEVPMRAFVESWEEDLEKFAELLIKECHETIKKDMELAQIQLLPLDFGMYANGRLRRIIKEHFGVE